MTNAALTSSNRLRAFRILALLLTAVLVLGFAFRNAVLGAMGSYLVKAENPEKADIALVLAGDGAGNRILAAAQLVGRGYVSRVLVSGPWGQYGHYECDLAIPFAVKAGYPESYFLHFENDANSTKEEARVAIARLHQLAVHKILLVTSDYHTRRAGRIYRSAAPDLHFIVVAAPDISFTVDGWWHYRQAQKTAFLEWVKIVTERFGI